MYTYDTWVTNLLLQIIYLCFIYILDFQQLTGKKLLLIYRQNKMEFRNKLTTLSSKMANKLETVSEGFGLFKKMTEFVKHNFVVSLQTILLLILIAIVIFGFYYGSKFIERLLDTSNSYTVEETKQGFVMDGVVNAILSDMLVDYRADRARVVQFHNGTHNLGGLPFRYFSITHEMVDTGVSSEISNYQDIPTSVLGSYAEQMINHELVRISDVDVMTVNTFKQLLQEQGITGECMYPLFDNAGRFVGYLGLDYVGRSIPSTSTGGCICDTLLREAKTVQNVLFSSN